MKKPAGILIGIEFKRGEFGEIVGSRIQFMQIGIE